MNDVIRSVDDCKAVPLVLLDLSAAFDTIDHEFLLEVLRIRFSISDISQPGFHSYMTVRTRSISVNGVESAHSAVACSVPQWSVLRSIQFISYTEDVDEVLHSNSVLRYLFADNKQLYSASTFADMDATRSLYPWPSRLVCLLSSQINAQKTELMWFRCATNLKNLSTSNLMLLVGSDYITSVKVVNGLGVHRDAELTLKHHVNLIARTCFFQLRHVRQIGRPAGSDVTKRL